jgi:hypothetical protein
MQLPWFPAATASIEAADAPGVYSRPQRTYIRPLTNFIPDGSLTMRAEPQKLVDSINEALALLRRHL